MWKRFKGASICIALKRESGRMRGVKRYLKYTTCIFEDEDFAKFTNGKIL